MGYFQTVYRQHVWLFVLAVFAQFDLCTSQVLTSICDKTAPDGTITYQACFPSAEKLMQSATFNLTLTPPDITCGTPSNVYCKQSWQFGCSADETCDATNPALSHPKNYMVDDNMNTWWISKTSSGRNEFPVTIQMSFNKLYELAGNLMIVFYSGRPRNMTLEKSSDHGATWTPLQYYSDDCTGFSTQPATETNPTAVRCTTEYSQVDPKTGGIVQFEDRHVLLLGSLLTDYKKLFEALQNVPGLQEFLLFTDFRIQLYFPAIIGSAASQTLGDYYGITEILINGRCICNLHASSCAVINGETQCLCKHNTQGKNCEQCKPLYNNRLWQKGSYLPYPQGTANECQKCDCNEHALSCSYDDTSKQGVCEGCSDKTQGVNCEECVPGYYHNETEPLSSPNTCILCDCESIGTVPGSLGCSQAAVGNSPIGQCACIAQVTGRRCDICQDQFYGLFIEPIGQCKECACNLVGTQSGSNICDPLDGQCPCKISTGGRMCGICKDGFYGFPILQTQECTSCACDWGGSSSKICDGATGNCACRSNVQGAKCTSVDVGSYVPFLDNGRLEPVSGTCVLGTALQSDVLHDGSGFARCEPNQVVNFADLSGQITQPKLQWPYRLVVRHTHDSVTALPAGRLTVSVTGNSGLTDTSGYSDKQTEPITSLNCATISQLKTFDVIFSTGFAQAWISSDADAIVLDARCKYQFNLVLGQSNDTSSLIIDSLVLLPSITSYPAYISSDAATKLMYDDCVVRMSFLGDRQSLPNGCKSLTFSVMTQINMGAIVCECDPVGSIPATTCSESGGQCQCMPGVGGLKCDTCKAGFYNFTDVGCTECPTDPCPTVVPMTTTPPPLPPTTEMPITTTLIPENNGTRTNGTAPNIFPEDSSMVFIYMAIGIFIFILLVLCIILTILLIRRCRRIRKLRAENPALVPVQPKERVQPKEGHFSDSVFVESSYEKIGHNSDDVNCVENIDDERLITASIKSLNLNLQNGTEISVASRSSTPTELQELQMVSTPKTPRGSNKYLSHSVESLPETTPRNTPNEPVFTNKNGGIVLAAPVVMETNFSQPIRQPPDGMALSVDDEIKNKKDLKNRVPTSIEFNPDTTVSNKMDVKNNKAAAPPVEMVVIPTVNVGSSAQTQRSESPETAKFDQKPLERNPVSQSPKNIQLSLANNTNPIISNGTSDIGLKPTDKRSQLSTKPLYKPSPIVSKHSPSRQRRNRQIGILDPQKLVPELNYAGFGEFDELNGSLV